MARGRPTASIVPRTSGNARLRGPECVTCSASRYSISASWWLGEGSRQRPEVGSIMCHLYVTNEAPSVLDERDEVDQVESRRRADAWKPKGLLRI